MPQLPAERVEEEPKKCKAKEKKQPIAPIAIGGSGRIAKEVEGQKKSSPLPQLPAEGVDE